MTARLVVQLFLAAVILAALAFFASLLLVAQTVGDEAWHDSALPQSAFTNVYSGARRTGTLTAPPSAGPSNKLQAGTQSARPVIPSPSPRAVHRLAAASRTFAPTGQSVTGTASWFASPANVSAAGPALRASLGAGWRGTVVTVTGPAGSAVTVLGDWMARDRLIDLDRSIFPAVCGPLSLGLCRAEVSW